VTGGARGKQATGDAPAGPCPAPCFIPRVAFGRLSPAQSHTGILNVACPATAWDSSGEGRGPRSRMEKTQWIAVRAVAIPDIHHLQNPGRGCGNSGRHSGITCAIPPLPGSQPAGLARPRGRASGRSDMSGSRPGRPPDNGVGQRGGRSLVSAAPSAPAVVGRAGFDHPAKQLDQADGKQEGRQKDSDESHT